MSLQNKERQFEVLECCLEFKDKTRLNITNEIHQITITENIDGHYTILDIDFLLYNDKIDEFLNNDLQFSFKYKTNNNNTPKTYKLRLLKSLSGYKQNRQNYKKYSLRFMSQEFFDISKLNNRIMSFQDKTAPEILSKVLKEHSLSSIKNELTSETTKMNFVWNKPNFITDLDNVLLFGDKIKLFFSQEGKSKLITYDSLKTQEPISITYVDRVTQEQTNKFNSVMGYSVRDNYDLPTKLDNYNGYLLNKFDVKTAETKITKENIDSNYPNPKRIYRVKNQIDKLFELRKSFLHLNMNYSNSEISIGKLLKFNSDEQIFKGKWLVWESVLRFTFAKYEMTQELSCVKIDK